MVLDTQFWSKVDKTDNCWNWQCAQDKEGYGKFTFNGKMSLAHRISYEDNRGKIPQGLVLDHLCRNRKCCNPEHLEAVTQKENIRRGLTGKINNHFLKKTHCPQRHEYTQENTYLDPKGSRRCKICNLKLAAQYLKSKKIMLLTN